MTQISQTIEDDPLAPVRALATRRHVARLRPTDREVVSLLHGVGCAPLSATRVAERLGLAVHDVWRIHNRALHELGLLTILEAAA